MYMIPRPFAVSAIALFVISAASVLAQFEPPSRLDAQLAAKRLIETQNIQVQPIKICDKLPDELAQGSS